DDAVETGREHGGCGEVRVGGAIDDPVFYPSSRRNPDHLGAVRTSVGDVDRRPGGAGVGRPPRQALVGIDEWIGDGGQRLRVFQQSATEMVAGWGNAERVRVAVKQVD